MATDRTSIVIRGDNFEASLRNMDPRLKPRLTQRIVLRSAQLVVVTAQTKTIKRGGMGKPLKTKLTSRTGTLRRSIGVNLVSATVADVGSDLIYAAVHEEGGTFLRRAHRRGGRKVRAFTRAGVAVRAHQRGGVLVRSHKATFPKRPWLAPALKKSRRGMGKIAQEEWLKVMRAAPVPLPPGGAVPK